MRKKQIILIHIIFWLCYTVLPFLPLIFPDRSVSKVDYSYSFANAFLNFINFYLCYFITKPDVIRRNNLFRNISIFILFMCLFTFIRYYFTLGVYFITDIPLDGISLRMPVFISEFLNTLGFSFVPITIKFTIDWFQSEKLKTELINEKQASELAQLRSQINPHFLFNTLNNIYSLVYKKSDDAPEAIMKLSDIMRYMLYEAANEKVLLNKEIAYLKSYIELQSIRLHDPEFVEFTSEVNENTQTLSPMLFIPFIENAFKHGAKNVQSPGIKINLIYKDSKLILTVSNFMKNDINSSGDTVGGIGLHNVRRRLTLLYPDSHILEIKQNNYMFYVSLELTLHDN